MQPKRDALGHIDDCAAAHSVGVMNKLQGDISQCVAMINNVDTLIGSTTNQPETTASGFMQSMSSAANSTGTSSSSTGTATTASTGTTTGSTTGTTGSTMGTTGSSTSSTSGTSSGTSSSGSGSGSSSAASATTTLGALSVSASGAAPTPSAIQTQYFPYNLGVQGTGNYLTIFATKAPYAATQAATGMSSEQALDCDLRRITYWVDISGGHEHGGLYRQEIGRQNGDSVTDLNLLSSSMPPDASDPYSTLIAKGVLEVTFEYYDGMQWTDTWDGTSVNTYDEVTPIGPPVAVAINIKIARRRREAGEPPSDPKTYRSFRQVVSDSHGNQLSELSKLRPIPKRSNHCLGISPAGRH